ncbi:hypothetical protein [Marinobacter sp. SS21]|uniref:hypothetical protein n=1 Tax=Marinobacter sp. SS21 TaxID=2979460 RepID=UPI00232DA34D|nr:hypothetical protein [Marinobacter sp. SS21]MDC0660921.1 hypothetical protein [Marinobacter sp. SS21]
MVKQNRVARNRADLEQELTDQIALLKNSCQSYDSGLEAIGKHIALILRVLFHHHGQSRSLLEQLGLRNKRFFDSAGLLNPKNLLSEMPLIVTRASSEEARYLAACQAGGSPIQPKKIKFVDWWNQPVLKDQAGRKFCRRELVQHVANTDGGAHVDPSLEEAYMDLSRNNSLGWFFSKGDVEEKFKGKPELACIRQIAHETLLSLAEIAPEHVNA